MAARSWVEENIQELSREQPRDLMWVKGHNGTNGSEEADRMDGSLDPKARNSYTGWQQAFPIHSKPSHLKWDREAVRGLTQSRTAGLWSGGCVDTTTTQETTGAGSAATNPHIWSGTTPAPEKTDKGVGKVDRGSMEGSISGQGGGPEWHKRARQLGKEEEDKIGILERHHRTKGGSGENPTPGDWPR